MTDVEKLNEILNEEDFNRIDGIIMAGHDFKLSNKLHKYCYCAEKLEKENAELKERLKFFNAVGNTVDKQTYNAVVNENEVLKKEIEKLRKHNLNVQKICFDSCL